MVVTVPLGCLKRGHERMFEPRLPEGLVSAIADMGYGALDKVSVYDAYLRFEYQLWIWSD